LTISTFVGVTTDREVINVPLQVDGPRGEWVRALVIKGGDASLTGAWRGEGLSLSSDVSAVEVLVRID
jgi:hypothetical protein